MSSLLFQDRLHPSNPDYPQWLEQQRKQRRQQQQQNNTPSQLLPTIQAPPEEHSFQPQFPLTALPPRDDKRSSPPAQAPASEPAAASTPVKPAPQQVQTVAPPAKPSSPPAQPAAAAAAPPAPKATSAPAQLKAPTQAAPPAQQTAAAQPHPPAKSAPAPQTPASTATPSPAQRGISPHPHGENKDAIMHEGLKKAEEARLEAARRAGAIIDGGKLVPHPSGTGVLHQTGFALPTFREKPQAPIQLPFLQKKQSTPTIPYRDDRGRQHDIAPQDIRRVADTSGKVNYHFMVGGRHVSVPENSQAPIFQIDDKNRRYTVAADGTRRDLGIDPNAAAKTAAPLHEAAAQKAREEKLEQGKILSAELSAKRDQAAKTKQELETAQQIVTEMDQAPVTYREGPQGLLAVRKDASGQEITAPVQDAAQAQTARDWIQKRKSAEHRLGGARGVHVPLMQEVDQLQAEHDDHYRRLAAELRSRNAETNRIKNAAIASPTDPQWVKDHRSLEGEPRVADIRTLAEQEKADPAKAEALRQSLVHPQTSRFVAAADAALGPAATTTGGQAADPAAPGKSMTLHDVLMQAPGMTLGKGEQAKTIDQAEAALHTAQAALGIADPKNVHVTRSAEGGYSLSRKDAAGKDQPFATLDPKNNRITLTPGADGKLSQAALDLAAKAAPSGTPVYLPGGQPPLTATEFSALISKGQQAASTATDRTQADAALTAAGLSPEGISALRQQGRISLQDAKLLNDKFNSGVSSYADRDAAEKARQQDASLQQTYQQAKGTPDKPNFQSWMDKGDPQRDAQVQAKAKELRVSEDAVRRDLETRRLSDFSTASTQQIHDKQNGLAYRAAHALDMADLTEPSRVLPDGSIAVNPALSNDQAKFEQAIELSPASREAKEAARQQWTAYHDAWLTQAAQTLKSSQTLPGVQDYNTWLTSNTLAGHFSHKQPDGTIRHLTDNEKTQLYIDSMKNRNGFVKFMDNVSTSLVAGGGQVVSGLLGAQGLAKNAFQDLTGIDIGGQSDMEAAAAMARQNQALTQSHDITGTADGPGGKLVSGVTQAVPSIGVGVMTGGSSALALGAVQSAGSTYTDLYQHHIAEGLTPEEAHKKAAGTAIASGVVTGALSKVMPGGAQALNNPATREAARQSFSTVLKTFAKGALKEIPQEVLDGGFNHFTSEMNKGRSIEQAAASYAEQFPQSILTAALLGGGMEATAAHHGGGKPPPSQQPPGPAQPQPTIPGNTTQPTDTSAAAQPSGQPSQTTANNSQPGLPRSSQSEEGSQTSPVSPVSPPSPPPKPPAPTRDETAAAHQTVEKIKAQKEPLSPEQQKELAAAEKTVAQKTEANLLDQKAALEAAGKQLHPAAAKALADAQAKLASDRPALPAPSQATGQPSQTSPDGQPSRVTPSSQSQIPAPTIQKPDAGKSDDAGQPPSTPAAPQSSSGSLPGTSSTINGTTPPAGTTAGISPGSTDHPPRAGGSHTTSTADSSAQPQNRSGSRIPVDTTSTELINLARTRAKNLKEIATKRQFDPDEQGAYDNARHVLDRTNPTQPGDRNSGNPQDLVMAGGGAPSTQTQGAAAQAPPPSSPAQPTNAIGTAIQGPGVTNADTPRASATDGSGSPGAPAAPQQQLPLAPQSTGPTNATTIRNGDSSMDRPHDSPPTDSDYNDPAFLDNKPLLGDYYLHGPDALQKANSTFGDHQGLARSAAEAVGQSGAYDAGSSAPASSDHETDALTRFARKAGLMLDAAGVRSYMEQNKMVGGSEHRVSHIIPAGRVLKDLDAHALATESLYDYLTDQQLANHFFGDAIRVEGFYQHLGRLHIITSQPFVKGTHPTWQQLKAGLVNQGFIDPSPYGQSGSFILPHPELGEVDVIDLHTNNAVLGADGSIHPIDVHFYFDSHDDRVKALQSLGLQP